MRATAARFIDIAEQHNIDQRRRAELVAAVLEPLAREDAGVGAVEVVVDEVLLEVVLEGGGLGDQRAGEGGAPALFEDGELDALDAALLLGRPARIKRWRAPSAWTAWPKSLARNFGAVVGGDLLGCQPACASSRATRCTSSRVWRERGLRSLACSSAQQNAVELPGFGGHVGLGGFLLDRHGEGELLELRRREVAERRVQALPVVERFDELEDGGPCFGPRGPVARVDELLLERLDERFGDERDDVVGSRGLAGPAHRGPAPRPRPCALRQEARLRFKGAS